MGRKAETWIDGPNADFGAAPTPHIANRELQQQKKQEFWIDGPNATIEELQNFELKVSAPKHPRL